MFEVLLDVGLLTAMAEVLFAAVDVLNQHLED